MASFSDQISTFNPYVSQLPVEEMAKVGMQKQQQYDQGVQKIQGYIDNIAGMDVVKDNQKQYLQSKLNELGSSLKTVAAGDFSNQQLVNSVGGMATSIVKDPIVQTAVSSTQKFRREQSRAEQAKKEGKSSPENEAYFNNQLNNWLNDGKVDSSFNGEYTEYTDVGKKLREVADKVHELDSSIDMPYQRDAAGNVLKDKSGRPIVDNAMLRIKTKGKPAQKILDNFYDSLDEKDQKQLRITGWYHYRGADKDTFKRDIVSNYTTQKKMLSDNVVDLAVELQTNPKLNTVQKAAIQAKINSTNTLLKSGKLDTQMNDELSGIDNIQNLDEYKYKLYSQKYLTGLAKDMSYQSTQEEILSNPYKQVDLQIAQMNQTAANERQAHLDRMASLGFEKEKFAYQVSKDSKEAQGSRVTPVGISTDVEAPTLGTLSTAIEADSLSLKELNAGAGDSLYSNLTAEQRQKSLDKLYSDYKTSPKSITNNDQRDYVEARRMIEAKISQKNNLSQAILKGSAKFDQQIDEALKDEKPLTFTNGQVLYTARDLFKLEQDAKKFYKTSGMNVVGGTLGTNTPTTIFDAKGLLDKYAGTNLEPAAKAYVKRYYGQQLTPTESAIISKSKAVGEKYSGVAAKALSDQLNYQSTQIAKYMPELQTQRGTLNPTANKTDAAAIEDLLTTKFGQYSDKGALDTYKGQFDPSTITTWRGAKNADLKYSIEKSANGSAKLIIQNGEERQTIPMTAEELGIFFPAATKTSPLAEIKFNILSSTNHTTNSANIKDDSGAGAVGAYLSGYNVAGLKDTKIAPRVRFDVEGSSNNNGEAGDKFQLKMYVLDDNNIWKSVILNQAGWATEAGIQTMLDNIGTNTVDQVLKQR